MGDYYGAYRAMEEYYKAGKIKAIGISNFAPDRVADLAIFADVTPMVNQVETHVFNQQLNARKTMDEYGVQIESWDHLQKGAMISLPMKHLLRLDKKYHKSAAQVALRYFIQRDVIVIPKTVHKNRMEQNFDVLLYFNR